MSGTSFEQLIIRRFEPSDLDQAIKLNEEASRSTGIGSQSGDWAADLANIDDDFINNGGDFLVGLLRENLVVMGGFKKLSETTAEIKRMRVTPVLQGQGIGRSFLNLLESRILEEGYSQIDLSTTSVQVGAQRLYEGAGYTETKKEVDGDLVIFFYHKQLA